MTLQFEISGIEVAPLVDGLRNAGIDYKLSNRRGFDGMAVAALAVSVVSGLGGIITPIILHMLSQKEPDEIEFTINGITISGLSEDQIGRLIEDLARKRARPDED